MQHLHERRERVPASCSGSFLRREIPHYPPLVGRSLQTGQASPPALPDASRTAEHEITSHFISGNFISGTLVAISKNRRCTAQEVSCHREPLTGSLREDRSH